MDITIHTSTLPHDDPDASLAFWRDVLGFQVRWIRVGPRGQPDTSILLAPLCHASFATAAEGNPHIERWNGCLKRLVEHLGSRSAPA
jgi:catechol 2,3-dioxygenase-like lactoylglutathione lyase family enzyme